MRINKFIASKTGYSRRKADILIEEGKVNINGKKLNLPGYDVGKDDVVEVEGKILDHVEEKKYYYVLNKPKNVISSVSDDFGRMCVTDFFPSEIKVYPVGRLDYDSRGLLLMTNDGELMNRLIHPRNHISKTYIVKLNGRLSESQMRSFRNGIYIEGRKTQKAEIDLYNFEDVSYRVVLYEGRNRQIRKMVEKLGRRVEDLERIAMGKIKLGNIAEGKYRKLSVQEKKYLQEIIGKTI